MRVYDVASNLCQALGVGGQVETTSPKSPTSSMGTGKAKGAAAAVAASTLGRILTGAVEGTPKIGFMGASELAARHRRRDPALNAGWLKVVPTSEHCPPLHRDAFPFLVSRVDEPTS